jgi:hypothetical protein
MIRMQIVGRSGVKLYSLLKRAIRSKELRTFSLERKGARVVHVRSPGFMTWADAQGVVACEIKSPHDEGKEWQLLTNVVGRLADRYPAVVESINIQLTAPAQEPKRKGRRRRR